jgi:LuxR family maltose regulon positive regulatory protein
MHRHASQTSQGLQALQALPADLLSQLHRKTEGWVAAIWLASMALERHGIETGFVERFSGSDRAVAEYLAEDVLAHQPREIRDFLLRTSILRQLDASVCQALNPRIDCAALLEQLAAANLFLTPVSGDGRAWRYHSLFADFLRAQLAREHPGEIERLHLAASGWYESQDRPVPAIDHAIEGGDHPHALTLLDSYAGQFLEQGRMRMLARWFSAIPEHQLRAHPFLQPIALWATCFTHGPWEAMQMLEQSGCIDSEIPEVRASAHALVPLLLAMQDRHDEAYEVGRTSLARMPTGLAFADSVLLNAMATSWPCAATSARRSASWTPRGGNKATAPSTACTPSRWPACSTCTKGACARRPRGCAWRSIRRMPCPTTTATATRGPACCMPAWCTSRTSCRRPTTC